MEERYVVKGIAAGSRHTLMYMANVYPESEEEMNRDATLAKLITRDEVLLLGGFSAEAAGILHVAVVSAAC